MTNDTKPNTLAALGALEFNTKLARKLRGLKKSLGATGIRQAYRGTGSRKHRRQLWVRMPGLAQGFTDLWLDATRLRLGGVSDLRRAEPIPYGTLTVDEVYGATVAALTGCITERAA